jgi:N-acyl-D-amino-acid deacylase
MQAGIHDVMIRQAAVFDGLGNPPFIADVAIDDDRITHVGEIPERGGIEIDGRGLAVAPGLYRCS